jgi:arsenate reductase
MTPKQKALFVCLHNSARSQMAEAYLNKFGGDRYEAESAGLEPGKLNPFAVQALKEDGIDISQKKTQGVFELFKQGRKFDLVITVCDGANGESCPLFQGKTERLHWEFPDPSSVKGTDEEKLDFARKVRDQIKEKISNYLER